MTYICPPQASLDQLSTGMEGLGSLSLKDIAGSALASRDQAQALLALAMGANTLLRSHSQLHGRDPDSHVQLHKEQACRGYRTG